MKGMGKVFSFTLRQLVTGKVYYMLTIIVAILLFAIPAGVFPFMEYQDMKQREEAVVVEEAEEAYDEEDSEAVEVREEIQIDTIYLIDQYEAYDWYGALKQGIPEWEKANIIKMDSLEAANASCKEGEAALALVLSAQEEEGSGLQVLCLVPDKSSCSGEASWVLAQAFDNHLGQILLPNLKEADLNKLEEIQIQAEEAAAAEVENAQEMEEETMSEEEASMNMLQNLFGFILPYLNIMVIYFLVLYYGQTVANNVIQEKNSKLMDTLLISVKPRDLILGKVVATWTASLIQFMSWVIALLAGIGLGEKLSLMINPQSSNMILFVIEVFKNIMGSFALPSLILAILLVLAGFFLYCALSSIGGSLASKPEELSSTNLVFVVILIGSFLFALSSGFLNGDSSMGLTFYDCFPFTSVLLTPSRILLGQVSFGQGLISLGIILALSILLMVLAGKIYTMMAMYRGKVPSPKQLIAMFRGK